MAEVFANVSIPTLPTTCNNHSDRGTSFLLFSSCIACREIAIRNFSEPRDSIEMARWLKQFVKYVSFSNRFPPTGSMPRRRVSSPPAIRCRRFFPTQDKTIRRLRRLAQIQKNPGNTKRRQPVRAATSPEHQSKIRMDDGNGPSRRAQNQLLAAE